MNTKFVGDVYGLTNQIFVNHRDQNEVVILGGVGAKARPWRRTLTHKAAYQLWTQLTHVLFPDKANKVIALTRLTPHAATLSTATSPLEIAFDSRSCLIDIMGRVANDAWWFQVDDLNARLLLEELGI